MKYIFTIIAAFIGGLILTWLGSPPYITTISIIFISMLSDANDELKKINDNLDMIEWKIEGLNEDKD